MGWTRETVLKVAKRTGYPVKEAWSSHNAGQMGTVYGPMLHHTGSNATGDYPTLAVVRDGRSGLENSLCMYGLGRSGTIYCINEKISWHAGVGSWNGVTDGNGHFAGIEAESNGGGKDWTPQQLDAYKKLVASILIETGRNTDWMPMHKQFATPSGRKTDPAGIELNAFKADVQKYLNNPSLLGAQNGGGFLMALSDAEQGEILNRLRAVDARTDWALAPEDGFNSKGEVTKRVRDISGNTAETRKLVEALNKRDPAAIAAAIPNDIAQQVATNLAARLND